MKRHGRLWPQVVDFGNLLRAARQAQRGKRLRDNVLAFNHALEPELLRLEHELLAHTYRPGAYRTFRIVEPKKRLISAAPYRDRVVHHALCNVIAPLFERGFIRDSYANRTGFGTHRALRRFTRFLRASRYVLQADVRQYFPSIDHAILKEKLRRKIKCIDTLWLVDQVLDASNAQDPAAAYFPGDDLFTPHERRRGLPIGNLTSQFFANVYLDSLDHLVKERLRVRRYVRYVDDFALFGDDRAALVQARAAIEEHLAGLRLRLHPVKTQLFETRHGADFVGFRVLKDRIRVRAENLRRARRRLRRLQRDYRAGRIGARAVTQSIRSWVAHLEHGDTWQLRGSIFDNLVFQRG